MSTKRNRDTLPAASVIMEYLHRPPSAAPGRTPSHHRDRRICQPRSGVGKLTPVGSRSGPSCFERREIGGANFESSTSEELSLTDLHDDCVWKLNETTVTADDAAIHNNTTLSWWYWNV